LRALRLLVTKIRKQHPTPESRLPKPKKISTPARARMAAREKEPAVPARTTARQRQAAIRKARRAARKARKIAHVAALPAALRNRMACAAIDIDNVAFVIATQSDTRMEG